jgi:hypothetical protein
VTSPHPDTLPLVGLIEVAQRAGVARPTVSSWRTRPIVPPFPQPVAELAVGPVFWWPAVREWLEATGRRHDVNLSRSEVVSSHRNKRTAAPSFEFTGAQSPTAGRPAKSRPQRPIGPLTAAQQEAVDAGLCMLAPDGCDGKRAGAWTCAAHRSRWLRTGDLGNPVVRRDRRKLTPSPAPQGPRCTAPVPGGCPEPQHAMDLCRGHYSRLMMHGDPGTTPIEKRARWTPPDVPSEQVATALEQAGGDMSRLRWNAGTGQVEVIPRRQRLTREEKAKRGVGRPPALDDDRVTAARARVDAGETVKAVAGDLGVAPTTLSRYLDGWRPARQR